METEVVNGYLVTIEQDTDVQSPAEDQDKHAFIVTTRNRYFEVEGPNGETASTIGENLDEWEKTHFVLKLYMYQHSGTALSLTPFSCPWDSGQVGFLLVTRDESEIPYPEKYASGMIETWNQYLSGDVWGYVIEDGDENNVDSCWGFYGFDNCKNEALDIAQRLQAPEVPYDSEVAELREQWQIDVRNGYTRLGFEDWRKEND